MNMSFGMQNPQQNSVQNMGQKKMRSRGFLSWLCACCCVAPEEHERQEREKQEIKSKATKAKIKEKLDRANGPTSATAGLIQKNLENKKQIFISAVNQGNMALVRECLEEDAGIYLPEYEAQAEQEGTATGLTLVARNLLEHRKEYNLLAQKDTNLDRLAGIALIRLDCHATRLFLQAGADIKAFESAQFTWKQIENVTDCLRFGVSGHTDTLYTPLHYFLQYKQEIGDWNRRSYDTMIQELVTAGVNFHAPTSVGHETILEAGKHDRAVIKRAEKARKKQLQQATNSAGTVNSDEQELPPLQPSYYTPEMVDDLERIALQDERERVVRELVREAAIISQSAQQQIARVSEQEGHAPKQDVLQQNTRMRERSAPATIPE